MRALQISGALIAFCAGALAVNAFLGALSLGLCPPIPDFWIYDVAECTSGRGSGTDNLLIRATEWALVLVAGYAGAHWALRFLRSE